MKAPRLNPVFLAIAITLSLFAACSGDKDSGDEPVSDAVVQCPSYNADTHFCDARDGKVYKYVAISYQTWMAENLNYNAPNSRCYGDDTGGDSQGNCASYGRLYDWATAMALPPLCNSNSCESSNIHMEQGICPSGWNIPSDYDWQTLIGNVEIDNSCSNCAGHYLKAFESVGEDKYYFRALLGGYYDSSRDYFEEISYSGIWWSSVENSVDVAYKLHMKIVPFNNEVSGEDGKKKDLYSVRCIKTLSPVKFRQNSVKF